MNNENKTPRHHGPNKVVEHAKDFKGSLKRLIKELKKYRILILISLVLAALGSILSIFAPNILSDLTDEISKGLVVNTNNIEKITKVTTNNINSDATKLKIQKILNIKLDENTIKEIMSDNDISDEQKNKFSELLKNNNDFLKNIESLDDSILNKLFEDSIYDDEKITKEDKIELLKTLNDTKNIKIPESISKVIFDEIEIDNTKISSIDQVKFLTTMSKIKKDTKKEEIYSKIDEMPDSIKKVISPTMNIEKIRNIALTLVILYLVSALFTYIESISMTDVANKFARNLRSRISKKINKLPLKYFDKHSYGDILSRVTNDVDTVAQTMNNSLATLVSATTLFVGTIIMMFYTNVIMALTAIISSLIGFVFMFKFLSKSQKYFILKQKELGEINGHIEEIYSGLNVVKTYNGIEDANKKFDELNEKLSVANRKSQFLSGLMMPMMNFIGNLGYVAVCIVGALLALNGNISFGVIVAFITYVRLFTSPLSQIAQAFNSLQSTMAASERVFEFLDEEEMEEENDKIIHLDKDKVEGNIEFDNVVFTYSGNTKPTINGFSAKALKGQKIAIVGPTGAGKTTMVNLLMKFYNINSGDIKIDGVSTKNLTRENIHELFTMVLQDTWVFNGTIKENIIYNRKNITDEEVEKVCKIVGLDHFIKTLPNGYDSVVKENDSISAGQKQLLTIARGMIENAPFLILDEATSNVDTRTEELVQNAMDKLTKGKTSFIIAHRLSTIKNADLILVMKDGNIIEQGNHKELIKKNGFYAELYNSQFQK